MKMIAFTMALRLAVASSLSLTSSTFHGVKSAVSFADVRGSMTMYADPYPSTEEEVIRTKQQFKQPPLQPYVRWQQTNRGWEMQTAVTTFRHAAHDETVELHAQLHYGDPAYFDYYSSDHMKSMDSVLYELLVDDSLLAYQGGKWRVKSPIMASPNDQQFASQYGWACQVDGVDYTQSNWVHADLSRQEFLKIVGKDNQNNGPLWKVAADPQSSSAAAEAISALLVGPPTLSFSTGDGNLKRKLFTNLFLPGDSFANYIRAILWLTVPTPEVSIALFDWASLLQGSKNLNGFSSVALPISSNLLRLNLLQVRRLLFGQTLISSSAAAIKSNHDSAAWSNLVIKRNDHALNVLDSTLQAHRKSFKGEYYTALLYGSSHCPDLHAKLVAKGFRSAGTTWRTAWRVEDKPIESIFPVAAVGAMAVAYLSIGALDWVAMMGDVSQAWFDANYVDAGLAAGLYLIRHVLLYLGLSKFFVDWNGDDAMVDIKT